MKLKRVLCVALASAMVLGDFSSACVTTFAEETSTQIEIDTEVVDETTTDETTAEEVDETTTDATTTDETTTEVVEEATTEEAEEATTEEVEEATTEEAEEATAEEAEEATTEVVEEVTGKNETEVVEEEATAESNTADETSDVVVEDATALSQVTGVKQYGNVGIKYFNIQWNAQLDADGYEVWYSLDNKSYVQAGYGSDTDAWVSVPSAGTTYYVKVRSYTKAWSDSTYEYVYTYGAYSTPIKAVSAPNEAPKNLKQTKANSTTSVTLSWSKVTGASGYKVEYSINGGSKTVYVTKNSVTLKKLQKNGSYSVKVSAYRTNGTFKAVGDYSSDYGICPLPTKVTGVECDTFWPSFGASIIFNTVTNADGYQAKYYKLSGKKWKLVETKTGSIYSLDSSSKLKKGQFYKVIVRAYVNVNSKKAYGAWSTATYIAGDPKTVKIGTLKNSKQKVSWSKVTGATSYTVYISTDKKSRGKKLGTTTKTSITATKYGKSKLKSSKTYYYTIVANRKVGKKTYKATPYYSYYIY